MTSEPSAPKFTTSAAAVLTVAQVAKVLQCSEKTVRRRLNDGSLPAVRIGRLLRIPAAALRRLMA